MTGFEYIECLRGCSGVCDPCPFMEEINILPGGEGFAAKLRPAMPR